MAWAGRPLRVPQVGSGTHATQQLQGVDGGLKLQGETCERRRSRLQVVLATPEQVVALLDLEIQEEDAEELSALTGGNCNER